MVFILQDWEFPRFKVNPNIKLPGLNSSSLHIDLCFISFTIEGRWFTYSLLGMVLFVDCYNFKNALTYAPNQYNQYIDQGQNIISYIATKDEIMAAINSTAMVWETKTLNMKFENYDIDTLYEVSLICPIFAFVFSNIFGFVRSRVMEKQEHNIKTQHQLRNIPKIEDIKVKRTTGIMLKPLGNLGNMSYLSWNIS